MFDLKGKRALVTGSSRGIGKAIAEKLIAQGAEVIISGSNAETLEKVKTEIGAAGYIAADLSSNEGVDNLIAEAGSVDILVNNAGITKDGVFMRMSDEAWDDVLQVNMKASIRLTQGLIPAMMKARYGRIINISSVVAHMGNAGQANYITSKAAITGFTKALAKEVAKRGITANCVAPGFIETDMTEKMPEKRIEEMKGQIPAGRFGRVDEVASTVVFLASEESAYTTGTTIHVNGGMYV